ncbi:hypothetical protein [Pseudomonas alkylphenolica]|uniref:hypothetical protein n=1 Tax=Pseudomonas alkylphenolica TaxID=237609 RepID=UPI001F5029F5|nr:hypothetical protein [Pseudomonas alkylphenolica]
MSNAEPKSPLTIIAIFAGIIEASALASLPFLSEDSQNIYTWFLVGFPFFLTVLFFLTLNFNNKTLFTPPTADLNNAVLPAALNTLEKPTDTATHEERQLTNNNEANDTPPDKNALSTLAPKSLLNSTQVTVTITVSGAKTDQLLKHLINLALNQTESHCTHWIVHNLETGTRTTLNIQPMGR